MFDHQSRNSTKVHMVPDAALALPPQRIEVAGYTFWLRPSDLLRVETRTQRNMGFEMGVTLFFSDGTSKFLYDAGPDVADAIAAKLWSAGSCTT